MGIVGGEDKAEMLSSSRLVIPVEYNPVIKALNSKHEKHMNQQTEYLFSTLIIYIYPHKLKNSVQ